MLILAIVLNYCPRYPDANTLELSCNYEFLNIFWMAYLLSYLFCALFQLKRLKLRKNNWDAETYEFDEVLTEFASQKRVYQAVAKPVVEVCLCQSS